MFHLWMNRLALAAVLALLLIPTTGRMASLVPTAPESLSFDARSSAAMPGHDQAAGTAAGHPPALAIPALHDATDRIATAHPSRLSHPSLPDPAPAPGPGPGPHDSMPGDCAYCPLLLTMTALPPRIAPAAPLAQREAPAALVLAPDRGQRHPTGLGSRGPPRAA